MRLVSRFGFDLTFRTTGHDPWFDSIAKCQAHGLERYSNAGVCPRVCAFLPMLAAL
ncbi:MAG: hypothetical protein II846_06075 [Acetobacter sp.]|nr:hypothetical protein [Acetobacter sp.]